MVAKKTKKATSLGARLARLRPELAAAAQKIVDEWTPDDEGIDEEYGAGGACDAVARAMEDIVARHLPKARIREGGQEGSDHAYLVVYDDKEAYEVDVPPGVYEVGGGYSWRKIKDARVAPDDVVVHPIPRSWIEDEDDEAGYVEIEPLVCLGLGVAGALVAPTINERIIARPLGRHVPPSVGAVALTVVLAVAARRAGRLRLARGVAAAGVGLAVGTAATARRPRGLLGPTQP